MLATEPGILAIYLPEDDNTNKIQCGYGARFSLSGSIVSMSFQAHSNVAANRKLGTRLGTDGTFSGKFEFRKSAFGSGNCSANDKTSTLKGEGCGTRDLARCW